MRIPIFYEKYKKFFCYYLKYCCELIDIKKSYGYCSLFMMS